MRKILILIICTFAQSSFANNMYFNIFETINDLNGLIQRVKRDSEFSNINQDSPHDTSYYDEEYLVNQRNNRYLNDNKYNKNKLYNRNNKEVDEPIQYRDMDSFFKKILNAQKARINVSKSEWPEPIYMGVIKGGVKINYQHNVAKWTCEMFDEAEKDVEDAENETLVIAKNFKNLIIETEEYGLTLERFNRLIEFEQQLQYLVSQLEKINFEKYLQDTDLVTIGFNLAPILKGHIYYSYTLKILSLEVRNLIWYSDKDEGLDKIEKYMEKVNLNETETIQHQPLNFPNYSQLKKNFTFKFSTFDRCRRPFAMRMKMSVSGFAWNNSNYSVMNVDSCQFQSICSNKPLVRNTEPGRLDFTNKVMPKKINTIDLFNSNLSQKVIEGGGGYQNPFGNIRRDFYLPKIEFIKGLDYINDEYILIGEINSRL